LKPNLNVDLIARGSAFNYPMSEQIKLKLQLERGKKVYIYCKFCVNLLYIFNSRQDLYNKLSIHHKTLNEAINRGIFYLDFFIITNELVEEYFNEMSNLLLEENVINLIKYLKEFYLLKHPSSKMVRAEFKAKNASYSFIKEFNSINSLVKYLKGDKSTISKYLKNLKGNKLYRGK